MTTKEKRSERGATSRVYPLCTPLPSTKPILEMGLGELYDEFTYRVVHFIVDLQSIREKILVMSRFNKDGERVCNIGEVREKFGPRVDRWMEENIELIGEIVLRKKDDKWKP